MNGFPHPTGQRRVVEALGHQPALMSVGPGRPGPEYPAVAQQEFAEAMPGPGAILEQVGARHRSRTASSATVGMRMATSSPARCNRASRRQSRLSV
jgi:hypothetical protein